MAPDVLIVPMQDIEGDVQNVQLIDCSGTKSFLTGGRQAGLLFIIGKTGASGFLNPTGLNLICGDFETGASCFEAMDVPTVVAFDSDNLRRSTSATRAIPLGETHCLRR